MVVNRLTQSPPGDRLRQLGVYNSGAMLQHSVPWLIMRKRPKTKRESKPGDKETLTTTLSKVSKRWLQEIKARYNMTHDNEALEALISDCRYRSPGTLHRVSEEEGEYRWKQPPEDHREES